MQRRHLVYTAKAADKSKELSIQQLAWQVWKSLLQPRVEPKYLIVLIVLIGIIFSLFFDDISSFGISTMGGYLIISYIILSLIWKMDSRIFIAVALLFLASCPFLLIAGQEQLAEEAAIYAYYFLAIGVGFKLKEYLVESKAEQEETKQMEIEGMRNLELSNSKGQKKE